MFLNTNSNGFKADARWRITFMRNLKSSFWIGAKAILLLLAGTLSAATLIVEHPSLKEALLLGVTIWSFCRVYYFLFYVIERYVDEDYRFSGLLSFAQYILKRQKTSHKRSIGLKQ